MDTEKPADDTIIVEELDSVGDVVLVVRGDPANTAKFLVSSKVLGLASPVFATLFSQNFSEGVQLLKGNRPEITLREDDPAAMRKILNVLHYKEPGDGIDVKMVAALAIHCDKYACIGPLKPWIKIWITSFESTKSAEDYGLLLLAAHFFKLPDSLAWVYSKAEKDLTPEDLVEWEVHEHLKLLPDVVISAYIYPKLE